MIRREFIKYLSAFSAVGMVSGFRPVFSILATPEQELETTKAIFDSIINKRMSACGFKQPIGELIGQIADDLTGIPYLGGTLEGPGAEICRVNLNGLDCDTFFENVLVIARK
jgi:hypothetical protein